MGFCSYTPTPSQRNCHHKDIHVLWDDQPVLVLTL